MITLMCGDVGSCMKWTHSLQLMSRDTPTSNGMTPSTPWYIRPIDHVNKQIEHMVELISRGVSARFFTHNVNDFYAMRIAVRRGLIQPDSVQVIYFEEGKQPEIIKIMSDGQPSKYPMNMFNDFDTIMDELLS